MADDARHTRPDLTAATDRPTQADFFELLRQIEVADGRRFGRSGGAGREPARLCQNLRQSFATSDVAALDHGHNGAADRVEVNVLGLLGPEGPMPLHLTRWVLGRLSNRWFAGNREAATSDTAFLDFSNLLSHRMIALYWRAWADARPEVRIAHDRGGQVMAVLRTLAGLSLAEDAEDDDRDRAKLRHATSLAQYAHGPERLTCYLADVAGAPVAVREFIGVWTEIPLPLQTRLGDCHAGLGQTAVVGARTFERQSRAELRLGPLDLPGFRAIIEDPEVLERLRHAILFAVGLGIEFDLRLVLAAPEVPEARLGACRLGRTTWIAGRDVGTDADDLVLRGILGRLRPADRPARVAA